jgi:hypothetical protein
LVSAATFHAFCGDTARAATLAAQAMEVTLSPSPSHWVCEASIRYLRGDDQGAVVAVDRARDALLTLPALRAAALFNLGRADEARIALQRFYAGVRANWIGDDPPTDRMIARWYLHLYPISDLATWQRLRDGMAAIGMPVEDLVHDAARFGE